MAARIFFVGLRCGAVRRSAAFELRRPMCRSCNPLDHKLGARLPAAVSAEADRGPATAVSPRECGANGVSHAAGARAACEARSTAPSARHACQERGRTQRAGGSWRPVRGAPAVIPAAVAARTGPLHASLHDCARLDLVTLLCFEAD